ncbi:uncharacterized protein LOC122253584 [Penaeus japonicus]|uniref:uncharacterized protein LOC122253584 n=1 Tax=Penaeus japonicus TaxID=27405 RepID=UPI001C716855|nr:uncharacterized protein LOC122253584 [Penaeus japonicus]
MDTDQDAACDEGAGEDGPEDALAPHLEEESNPEAESAPLDDDAATDHMDCDDSESAPMFIDDDSSSRAFPEGAGDLSAAGGSPSAPSAALPEASRRNKRKNFKPRNIVYTYTDSDDTEGASDSEGRGRLAARDADNEGSSASELPLDLSETPTLRRTLLPRRLDEAVDLTGGGGVSVSGAGGSPLHPRLNALLARPTSPGPHEEGGPGGAEPSADMKEYAELTMRRLLGLYGFHDFAENLPPPPAAFFPGESSSSSAGTAPCGTGRPY